MCRFLIAHAKTPFDPEPFLTSFATLAKDSKTLDGDWQGDGWGIRVLTSANQWKRYYSLLPIWEDSVHGLFQRPVRFLMVHARSASFPSSKGVLSYNQPYFRKEQNFVFNGLLKGVAFPIPVAGAIGAQKIWSILQNQLEKYAPKEALEKTITEIREHAKQVNALNIGFSNGEECFAYSSFALHPDYYQLRIGKLPQGRFVVSEPLSGFPTTPIPKDTIVAI